MGLIGTWFQKPPPPRWGKPDPGISPGPHRGYNAVTGCRVIINSDIEGIPLVAPVADPENPDCH